MSDNQLTIRDRLEAILESINLIIEWTDGRKTHNNQEITVAECKTMNCIAQALCHTKDNWWK